MSIINALRLDPNAAAMLAGKGRNGDTMLAHINPREAALLKAIGGSGTINPATGLPEFWDLFDSSTWGDYSSGSGSSSDWSVPTAGTGDTSSTTSSGSSGTSSDWSVPTAGTGSGSSGSSGGNDWWSSISNLWNSGGDTSSGTAGAGTAATTTGSSSDWSVPTAGTVSTVDASGVTAAPSAGVTSAGTSDATGATAPATTQQTGTGGMLNTAKQAYGGVMDWANKNPGLVKALGVGGLGLINNMQANKAKSAGSEVANQYKGIANQYLTQGNQLISQGQTGNLTASQIQSLNALRAQARQQAARSGMTGGTAALQAEATVQAQAQKYAEDLVTQGLQMVSLGNQYADKAIQAGYAANQQAQQTSSNFYTMLAQMLMGGK